jgi:hypothetical protein
LGVEGASKQLLSTICSKVSAASVSSVIGYKLPAPTFFTMKVKPTTENYEISGTETDCTYGAETNMATIVKAVTLSWETISKPLTTAEMQQSIAKVSKLAKFKFTTYSGLGVPAFYFSLSESGITGQGITGVIGGTTYFGASVESKTVSKSTIAALAKLGQEPFDRSAASSWLTTRSRAAMAASNFSAMLVDASISWRNSLLSKTTTTMSVSASTVALRRAPSRSESSPKSRRARAPPTHRHQSDSERRLR